MGGEPLFGTKGAVPVAARQRSVLFLQGPPSPFARELGAALAARGAQVLRVNLCIGDWFWWHDGRAISYRGGIAGWERFLEGLIRRRRITDIVYFADRVPYHRIARRVAERLGVTAISYEYGYLRPDWIILEPGGQSAWSHFPTDLARIRQASERLPDIAPGPLYRSDKAAESFGDVSYYLSNYLLWFLWPRFRRDRIYNPVIEYLSYPLRFRRARRAGQGAASLVARLTAGHRPYYVVPLQMQNDYQIRANSPWRDQRNFLDYVLGSFAARAPADADLVVKVHPLDNGLENWKRHLLHRAAALGIAERVHHLDGGDLERLVARASGVVLINSTCGITALRLGCPLKAMGVATFDIPGLTHQGPLDDFWTGAVPPDPADVTALIRVLAHHAHVRGDFYGPEGRAAAVEEAARRIADGRVWTPIFEAEPPRLKTARALGLQVDA